MACLINFRSSKFIFFLDIYYPITYLKYTTFEIGMEVLFNVIKLSKKVQLHILNILHLKLEWKYFFNVIKLSKKVR